MVSTSTKSTGSNNLGLYLIITILVTIGIGSMVIPVADENDIYVEFTIHQPVLGAPEFTDINVYAHPSTLFQAPALGDILTSGNLVVRASTTTKEDRVTVGKITRTFSSEGVVVIRQVPTTEKEITVGLYQDGSLLTSQKVVLP